MEIKLLFEWSKPIDIAYLTEANIQGDVLYYVRSKAKNTERIQAVMAVPLRQEVKDIIAKWGIYKPYLFGIITPEMDALKKRSTVEDFVKRTNKQLNIIRQRLGLGKITTYTARHTAATNYLRLGADLKTIQEFLGHSSISTTEAYLKSIDMEGKKKLNQLL